MRIVHFIGIGTGIFAFFLSPVDALALTTISDCTGLQNMSNNLSEDYELDGDIDCTGVSFASVGGSGTAFTGTFDGNGHTISNLSLNNTDFTGLFGQTVGATIHDVRIESATVAACGSACGILVGRLDGGTLYNAGVTDFSVKSSANEAGGMIGQIIGSSDVDGVFASSGSITASGYSIGGLVGVITRGTINDAYADVTVDADGLNAGGLIGLASSDNDITVTNAYATGNVSGDERVGGLIGYVNQGMFGNCILNNGFSTGDVSGNSNVGSLVGIKFSACTITNSYVNDHAGNPGSCVGTDGNAGTTACTEIADNQSYFYDSGNEPMATWNFSTIWKEITGIFPKLVWASDTTAPAISTLSPADDAADAAITTNLVITFNETIGLIGTGSISIYKSSDDSLVEQIAVTGSLVTGSGSSVITIDPTDSLANATGYYVQISDNAFPDTSDNFHGGISDKTTWNFSTVAASSSSSSSSSSQQSSASNGGGSGGGRRGGPGRGGTAPTLEELKHVRESSVMENTPVHQAPVEPPEPPPSPFQERVCNRVMHWFEDNQKMLDRVNERLLRRFDFECL